MVCRLILCTSIIYIPYRSFSKNIARKRNFNHSLKTNDQKAVVYYYLAIGHFSHPFRRLAAYFVSHVVTTTLDARKVRFCAFVVYLPLKKSANV
jgi:hypothetical protein